MAETLTDKIKLSKRDTGDLNWGQGANANLDAIDAHAQQATLRPPRTLLATLGSGAVGANLLGSTSYFYKVTAVNAAGETTEGKIPAIIEAQVTQPATPLPVILQWETVKGATGYKVYKSTASGQEKFLASVSGEATSTYTDDGNTAVNGAISVPASNTARTSVSKIVAGTNVTVSPSDGTGEVTINASGGGPAGYATVVVAAPSGSAATDTANIQNAINAAAAAGGMVVLREGTYLINATLSIPSLVCIRGQGMDVTRLFASGLPGSAAMITAGAGNNSIQIQDLTLDFNNTGRGAITALDDVHFTGQDNRFTRVKFIRNAGSTCLSFGTIANGLHNIVDACQFIMNGSANATALFGGGDLYVSNCYFNNTVAMLRMITVGFNAYICNNLFELGASGTQVIFSNGGNDMNIANNTFQLIAGTWTNAIKAFGPTRYTIVGNTASAMAAGDINCSGANGVIACNAGFASYTGGAQVANDTQTFNGIAVSTTAPSAGQVLTASGPGAAAWQTPAAGGAGYATVVAATPTGVAATDTANIQAAINSLPAAGGTVVLREGTYAINAQIILPAAKPVWIVGQGRGTVLADAPSVFMLGIFKSPAAGNIPGLALSDFLVDGTNSGSGVLELAATSGQVFENIKVLRVHGNRSSRHVHANPATGTTIKSVEVSGCETNLGDKLVLMLGSGTIQRFTIRDNKTFNDINKTDSVLWIRGDQHVIEGNQFFLQAGTIGEGAIAIRDSTERCVIQGNLVRYQGLLAFVGFTPAGAVFRHNVVADNVNHDVDPLILKSIVLTGKGEVSNNIIAGNKLDLLIDLPTTGPSGNNVVVANKASSIQGGTSSDVIAATLVAGLRKLGEASPLTGDVKLEAGSGIALTQDAPNNKITIAAAGGAGNWTLVANLTNTAFGQTFSPDFTGLSLNLHRSYMLVFELSLSSGGAGPNWVALRLNGAAPTTLQQYMLTDQQGVTQDDEGATNAMAKILKVFPGGGSSVEVSGCIIITGKVNSGFPHAIGWYTVTNQSAVEQMHRGFVGLRMNLGSGVDLTSLGLFSNSDLNFLVAGSCRASLYQAQ